MQTKNKQLANVDVKEKDKITTHGGKEGEAQALHVAATTENKIMNTTTQCPRMEKR